MMANACVSRSIPVSASSEHISQQVLASTSIATLAAATITLARTTGKAQEAPYRARERQFDRRAPHNLAEVISDYRVDLLGEQEQAAPQLLVCGLRPIASPDC